VLKIFEVSISGRRLIP